MNTTVLDGGRATAAISCPSRKGVVLACLLISILTTSISTASAVSAQTSPPPSAANQDSIQDHPIQFTEAEQRWLAEKHIVRVRAGKAPPYSFSDGKALGLSHDYLNVAAKMAGFEVQYVPDISWPDALRHVERKSKIDLLPALAATPDRGDFLLFTQPYFSSPRVIYTRDSSDFVHSIEDLAGKTVSVEQGYFAQQKLAADYPGINLLVKGTTEDALESLSSAEADAYVGNLVAGTYIIKVRGFHNIKIAAPVPFGDLDLAMGIRGDWPELVSIIDKALATLGHDERTAIRERWLQPVRYEHGISRNDILLWTSGVLLIGMVLAIVWIVLLRRQILRRDTAERVADQQKRRFSELFQHAGDYVLLMKLCDKGPPIIADANDSALTKHGYTRDELIGKPITLLSAGDVTRKDEITQEIMSGRPARFETEHRCKDGSTFLAEASAKLVMVDEEKHVLSIERDITERKQAEKREQELQEGLARAERMESLAVLSGGIAHDLNNLFGPNVLLPSIILEDLEGVTKEQCKDIEEIRESLAVMSHASSRAAETIKDMSVLNRSHVRPTTPLDINDAISEYIESGEFRQLERSALHVSINVELDKDNPWILGTRLHIGRLLSNLIRNSILAIEGKGSISIRTSSVSVQSPITGYEVIGPNDYVVLEMSDTGEGISPETLARAFEPFFTTRKDAGKAGSGLGLSVVHGIVKNHDGFIDLKTEVGKGTAFALYLPTVERPLNHVDVAEPPVTGGTERILVVDDEPGQRIMARIALSRLGYRVTEATNGHEALALFEQAKTAGEDSPFDLVMLDMLMEIGFSGLIACAEILKLYPEQKTIIASGYAGDEKAEEEALSLRADWLTKPYGKDELSRAVRKRMDRQA